MKRAPSALVAIGSFGVAVATLSVATTAAIVLLAPQPPAVRVTAAEAITALRKPTPGFERRLVAAPPPGPRTLVLEAVIAAELGRPVADVRVLSSGAKPLGGTALRGASVVGSALRAGRSSPPPSFVLMQRGKGMFEMVAPGTVTGRIRNAMIDLPVPAFTTSVRQADGRWLSVAPVRPFFAQWQVNILIALAVSLLLLAPIAWIFARRLTRPFRTLARALDAGGIERIPREGPRELREAAAAIAAMQTRLAAEATERARMLTAIAHDLRTPLTGLRLRIEAAPESQRARMVADVDRMQAMIGEVLTFARDSATPPEVLDVGRQLHAIVEAMNESHPAIRLLAGDDARIFVPEPAFRRAIENLLRNAIDYAGSGAIRVQRFEDRVRISVTDTGPGIPAAERARLLLPFERGEASRNRETGGAGLGLSIVRDFAIQWRGDFALRDASGGGTVADLELPAA